jgi:excinuclease ABC subunit C
MVDNLKKTLRPTRQFRKRGVPGKAINPEEDVKELKEYLQLERLPTVMECFDISNISSNHIVASMVRFRNGVSDNSNYRRYRIKTVKGQDDFASMAEVVRRRYSRILLEGREHVGDEVADENQESPLQAMRRIEADEEAGKFEDGKKRKPFVRLPDLVIVDGGKGQLSMAVKELNRLGLHDLPVIGLAKQREEVFRPGVSEPLIIPHSTGALKLLQRIRDESHRVANGYHQILMKRRVEESILDDCPGISRARKERLLEKFGSVARMRKVSADEIAEVTGITVKLATEIVHFLKSH